MSSRNTNFGGTSNWVAGESVTSSDLNDTFSAIKTKKDSVMGSPGVNGTLSLPIGSIVAWAPELGGSSVIYDSTIYGDYSNNRIETVRKVVSGQDLVDLGMTVGQAFTLQVYSRVISTDYYASGDHVVFKVYQNTSGLAEGTQLIYIDYNTNWTTDWAQSILGITSSSWTTSSMFVFVTEAEMSGDATGYSQFKDVQFISPTAVLNAGWERCNGQLISDAESPFNNSTVPNLNNVTVSNTQITGTNYNPNSFTDPDSPFDLNDSTYAYLVSTTATTKVIGRTFPSRYVANVRFYFSCSSYSSTNVTIQKYNGSTWTNISGSYTSNQNTNIAVNDTIQGLAVSFNIATTSSRSCLVYALDFLDGEQATSRRFLRGSTTSGTTGGSDTHTHTFNGVGGDGVATGSGINVPDPGSTTDPASNNPPYYSVVWIMRIK